MFPIAVYTPDRVSNRIAILSTNFIEFYARFEIDICTPHPSDRIAQELRRRQDTQLRVTCYMTWQHKYTNMHMTLG